MDIGSSIRSLRIKKGVSQGDFAKKLGISQTSLSQIELNIKNPHKKNLECICKNLGISVGGLCVISLTQEDIPIDKRDVYSAIKSVLDNIFL